MSLNNFILVMLVFALIGLYYTFKPPPTGDAAICAELKDPATLPFISYNSQKGFDECVSRCMASVMQQVCGQLPDQSNLFSTRPEIKQKMLASCIMNIKNFVTNSTRCPYLHCEP